MNEPCVTSGGSARERLVFGPLPVHDRGGRLQAGGVKRLSFACFSLPPRQGKVGAAPHGGNANKPITNQGKSNKKPAVKACAANKNLKTPPSDPH
jgi:hypothetical protein